MASIAADDSTDEMEDFMERYPKDLVVGIDDFHRLDLKSILGSDRKAGYVSLWDPLTTAAASAIKEGRTSEGKALWLLADASSMMLHPSTPEIPFEPAIVMEGKRSSIPEDFTASDIEFFSTIVQDVDDLWLKARLADLIWISTTKARRYEYALIAIDAYRKIPLSPDTWARGVRECWERAISLSQALGKVAANRVREIEEAILALLSATSSGNRFFAVILAEILMAGGLAHDEALSVADKLESLAHQFDAENDLRFAREYAAAAADWLMQVGNKRKAAELTVFVAECWYREAVAQASSDPPSYLGARHFYEQSIHVYQAIPRDAWTDLHISERLVELDRLMTDAGRRSIKEMHVFRSPPINLKPFVQATKNAVSGMSALDAMRFLATAYPGADVERLKEYAGQIMRDFPLQSLISTDYLSDDGRVVAKCPGMGSEDDNRAVERARMSERYGMDIELAVKCFILPALDTIRHEHRLTEKDFISLAKNSPIVPTGHTVVLGKAMSAGYKRDFLVASSLMVPQVENIVRCVLKKAGVTTTKPLKNGVQDEKGFGTLMHSSEAGRIFGANLTWELQAIFCERPGPNVRNEIAHGFMNDERFKSSSSVYAWWLGFKIVFDAFWDTAPQVNTGRKPKAR